MTLTHARRLLVTTEALLRALRTGQSGRVVELAARDVEHAIWPLDADVRAAEERAPDVEVAP